MNASSERTILLCALLLYFSPCMQGQPAFGIWKPTGPTYGGRFTGFAVDEMGNLFISRMAGGVFHSTDNGLTWTNTWPKSPKTVHRIPGYASLWRMTGERLCSMSADSPRTKQTVQKQYDGLQCTSVHEIMGLGDGPVVAATDNGVFVLHPGHRIRIPAGLQGIETTDLAQNDSGEVYVATRLGALSSSRSLFPSPGPDPQSPLRWKTVGTLPDHATKAESDRDGVLWTIGDELYRSRDNGRRWESVSFDKEYRHWKWWGHDKDGITFFFFYEERAPDTTCLGTIQWDAAPVSVDTLRRYPERFGFASTNWDDFMSFGTSPVPFRDILPNAFGKDAKGRTYAGYELTRDKSGIGKSGHFMGNLDSGHPWSWEKPSRLAVDPDGPVFVQNSEGLFASTDGGTTWERTGGGCGYVYRSQLLRSILGGKVLLSIDDKIRRSTDRGRTFVETAGSFPRFTDQFTQLTGGTLLVGTHKGPFISIDLGVTWNPASDGFLRPVQDGYFCGLSPAPTNTVVALSEDPHGNVYACADGILYRTRKNEFSWAQISNFAGLRDLIVLRSGLIIVATRAGVYVSRDDGRSWIPSNEGVNAIGVTQILQQPGGHVLIVCDNGAILESIERAADQIR